MRPLILLILLCCTPACAHGYRHNECHIAENDLVIIAPSMNCSSQSFAVESDQDTGSIHIVLSCSGENQVYYYKRLWTFKAHTKKMGQREVRSSRILLDDNSEMDIDTVGSIHILYNSSSPLTVIRGFTYLSMRFRR